MEEIRLNGNLIENVVEFGNLPSKTGKNAVGYVRVVAKDSEGRKLHIDGNYVLDTLHGDLTVTNS